LVWWNFQRKLARRRALLKQTSLANGCADSLAFFRKYLLKIKFKMPGPVETLNGEKAWYKPRLGPMVLGEAPIYRSSDSTLHWLDVLKTPCELHILSINPESGDPSGEARVLQLEDSVSVLFFRKGVPKSYICAYYQGVAFLDEETGRLEVVREIIGKEEREERRFNDGGVDARGRFWLAEIDKKVCGLNSSDGLGHCG
jgi:hypothetical protein